MGCIFSIKTVKSLLTRISAGTCQWSISNFSYNNYMIYRYFLNLYRFTDKNLILKCHFKNSTKFRNMVRLVIKCLSNKVWDVFLVLKQ